MFKKRNPTHSGGYLSDFCDGEVYTNHPIFSADSNAIQIVLYYDDVEVANPLGSHRGVHKLGKGLLIQACTCINCLIIIYLLCIGLFYYFIANIEPKLRSALRCTQLIACITVPNLEKYGLEMVLKPFIRDVNKLSKVSRTYVEMKGWVARL